MKLPAIFKVTYLSKLKPSLSSSTADFFSIKNVMATRQFFYFLFFMGIADNVDSAATTNTSFKAPTLIVYKKKKKLSGFLRAPYKHKKAQIRLYSTCYLIEVRYGIPSFACN
jgi:hypothetical protein